ncbi:unnamed protein product [Ilex paraguariensis]|uniref:Uncharacterized protein n=1 Tax=Ilex paraguariensis TaxID=185542 RepID=A0ABC8TXH0_9AQUA
MVCPSPIDQWAFSPWAIHTSAFRCLILLIWIVRSQLLLGILLSFFCSSMASMKVLCRLSSGLKPLPLKLNKKGSISVSVSADISLIKSTSHSQPSSFARSFSRISQLPVELSSVESMMPLHSAIASARLRSCLSTESQRWGLIPQGISLPL